MQGTLRESGVCCEKLGLPREAGFVAKRGVLFSWKEPWENLKTPWWITPYAFGITEFRIGKTLGKPDFKLRDFVDDVSLDPGISNYVILGFPITEIRRWLITGLRKFKSRNYGISNYVISLMNCYGII